MSTPFAFVESLGLEIGDKDLRLTLSSSSRTVRFANRSRVLILSAAAPTSCLFLRLFSANFSKNNSASDKYSLSSSFIPRHFFVIYPALKNKPMGGDSLTASGSYNSAKIAGSHAHLFSKKLNHKNHHSVNI